ncbi:MAG: F0F1 ATP synthase subunit A [Halobacteriovoraceae bacterium]|nr:F0F1 ATP synthase subunit A [Halobacteriovoraceae bacterium]
MKSLLGLFSLFVSQMTWASGYTFFGHLAHEIHVPEHILTFAFIGLLVLIIGFLYRVVLSRHKKPIVPDRGLSFRNLFEGFGNMVYTVCVMVMGEEMTKKYYQTIVMVFLLIFCSNLIGLVPGFLPPTENINTTIALGAFAFIYYNYQGARAQGLWGHIKHFIGPVWWMGWLIFPIEIISHCVRPLSLALRLRGNMFGDHLVLGAFSELVPYVVPVAFLFLGLFVSFIQSFVFSLLTMVYIQMACELHDHDEHEGHEQH